MDESAHGYMLRIFRDMPDPRVDRTRDHYLHDILTITVCAVLAGLGALGAYCGLRPGQRAVVPHLP